ncbi:hypothetical protein ACWOA0_01250 [Ignavigranum ruoffiae]|uniref:Uncharacterized protein n=1 Tax=Ignavigranum ruoffiae TaxID=89093 RepID=A0A1H8Z9V0_9LACT|nr:hypothetical protein [Ignavigranum ruoffiae]UPQ85520.1 hypothetical protein M0R79_07665 [Ignavigranum ruoffiae]SEP61027.1 hypothetical protein SAMN04488558_101187 [Ignavigranum ruoffiae]
MPHTVYTNYWINRRNEVQKEHGSYETEEEALAGIKAWWELQNDNYRDVQEIRTNTGALEITYGDDNYYYRIEPRVIHESLPSRKYRLMSSGEIMSKRKQLNLDDETLLFDELAEPHRDRIIVAMADSKKAKEWLYTNSGKPILNIQEYLATRQAK